MARKRKTAKKDEEKENNKIVEAPSSNRPTKNGPIYTIFSNAQSSETLHKRYVNELRQLYAKIDHDAFMYTFVKMLKTVLEADDSNEYGNNSMIFCAKFVSWNSKDKSNPILHSTLSWVLSTISPIPQIRYRLCHFVNLVLNELGSDATLDDEDCDRILEYMLERLSDISALVRKQAVIAMQRLQVPDDPDDPVVRSYLYHLNSDPSPNVRMSVITSMGRNFITLPHILDRLSDIDEKVRRHMIMNMSSYPVRMYKVSQRLMLLEQGLNDRSDTVRKAVIQCMLKQWMDAYNGNLIHLTSALKIDATEEEIERFSKTAGQMLSAIFEQTENARLVEQLNLSNDGEFRRCVPLDALSLEVIIYWQCLSEYLRRNNAIEADAALPELSTFCEYLERFCEAYQPGNDKFQQLDYQTILLSLLQILKNYDTSDEVGRANMEKLLTHLLKSCLLNDKAIEVIISCLENLIPNVNNRFSFLREIINDICELQTKQDDLVHDRALVAKLLENVEPDLRTKITALKLRILDLEEQEDNCVNAKDYIRAQQANEERAKVTEEYMAYLQPLLANHSVSEVKLTNSKTTKQKNILKGLQIIFYMVASKKKLSLSPSICALYHDLICRHSASKDNIVRDWALRCGTAYAMIYEPLVTDVFDVLYTQFYKSNVVSIWETSAKCVFELLSLYGLQKFVDNGEALQNKTHTRVLYNTLDTLEGDGADGADSAHGEGVGIILMMSHLLDTCEDVSITRAIVSGFCRMILLGHLRNRRDILERLLRRYFNPNTDTGVHQILGIFFEHLVEMKMQYILQPCFLPMLTTVLTVNFDHPLHEVSAETVSRFFIDMMRQETVTSKSNLHNKIALSFLNEMHSNGKERKDICRVISKDLLTLHLNIVGNLQLKNELSSLADRVIKLDIDARITKNLVCFKQILNGEIVRNSVRQTNPIELPYDENHVELAADFEGANDADDDDSSVELNAKETNSADSVCGTVSEGTGVTTFGEDNRTDIQNLRRSLNAAPNCILDNDTDIDGSSEQQQQQATQMSGNIEDSDALSETEPPPAKKSNSTRNTRRRTQGDDIHLEPKTAPRRTRRSQSSKNHTIAAIKQTNDKAASSESRLRPRSTRIQAHAASKETAKATSTKTKQMEKNNKQKAQKADKLKSGTTTTTTTTNVTTTKTKNAASKANVNVNVNEKVAAATAATKRSGARRRSLRGASLQSAARAKEQTNKQQQQKQGKQITTTPTTPELRATKRASPKKRCTTCNCTPPAHDDAEHKAAAAVAAAAATTTNTPNLRKRNAVAVFLSQKRARRRATATQSSSESTASSTTTEALLPRRKRLRMQRNDVAATQRVTRTKGRHSIDLTC